MKLIARREVLAIDRDTSRELRLTFEIMAPYTTDKGDNYMCQARITGDINESFAVGGVDSLQALMLTIECLDTRYEEMKEKHYDFFWPDKTNPMKSFDLVKDDLKRFREMPAEDT
jgi:hypothetical protein